MGEAVVEDQIAAGVRVEHQHPSGEQQDPANRIPRLPARDHHSDRGEDRCDDNPWPIGGPADLGIVGEVGDRTMSPTRSSPTTPMTFAVTLPVEENRLKLPPVRCPLAALIGPVSTHLHSPSTAGHGQNTANLRPKAFRQRYRGLQPAWAGLRRRRTCFPPAGQTSLGPRTPPDPGRSHHDGRSPVPHPGPMAGPRLEAAVGPIFNFEGPPGVSCT